MQPHETTPTVSPTSVTSKDSLEMLIRDADVEREAEYSQDRAELRDIIERGARGEQRPDDGRRAIALAQVLGLTIEQVIEKFHRQRERVAHERLIESLRAEARTLAPGGAVPASIA